MPTPKPQESQSDYVERCIPIVIQEGTAKDGAQASAICHSMWKEHRKSNMTNDELLKAIKARLEKQSEFNRGIITADRYVKSVRDCVGSDICYRYAATKSVSFNDVLTKAANTLTYNNEDMLLEEQFDTKDFKQKDDNDTQIELPKNTLMVFKHVLTTSRKDRDGDVLRTIGAKPDPKMLLLWQHVHTLPIGKMLAVHEHTSKKLSLISAIVDINDLAHDAAVMVDNKMGRFSHGFKAIDFTEVKEDNGNGKPTSAGFDIKSFEIMEESLVSVPANVDADTEEVILSLVEGGKLTSPMMKGYGTTIREKRPVMSAGGIEFEEQKEEKHEDAGQKTGGSKCSCGGAPKQEDHKTDDEHNEESKNNEVGDEKLVSDKEIEAILAEKAGRVLNASNLSKLNTVRGHIEEIHNKEQLMTRAGKAKCKEAHGLLEDVIKSSERPLEEVSAEVTLTKATSIFVAEASYAERKKMIEVCKTLNTIEEKSTRTEEFLAFTGRS